MTVVQGQEIVDQSFVFEEVVFIRCKLKNCDLFYSGGDFEWAETTFENCRFHFRGPASRCQVLFRLLGMIREGPPLAPSQMSKSIQ